jgi:mono/diheme cytochrome c family protein
MKNKQWLWVGIPIVVVIALVAYSLLKTSGPHPGEVAYENYCASCHGNDGKGVGELVPPVYQSSLLKENPDQLACIIIYGMQGPVEVNGVIYNQPMLGLEGQISEMELTNLVNFLLQEWNDVEERQTINDNGKNLENC